MPHGCHKVDQMKPMYLTASQYVVAKDLEPIIDTAFPTMGYIIDGSYKAAKMGLSNPAHNLVTTLFDKSDDELGIDYNTASRDQALIFASGNTVFAGVAFDLKHSEGAFAYKSKLPTRSMTQIYAGSLAQRLNAWGHISTDSTACVSSYKALMDAIVLIQHHGFERVAIIATEDQICAATLEFFGGLKASLSLSEYRSGILPSAFDSKNQGFFLGQGAAMLWVETEEALIRSQRTPVARLCSAAVSGEACASPVSQSADGFGYQSVIKNCLNSAAIPVSSVKIIKTHGTGTIVNNQSESTALKAIFGNSFRATSFKPDIGHTLGASGLIESIMMMGYLQKGVVPAISNRTDDDEVFLSMDFNDVKPEVYFLSLGAGMGNVYGSALFQMLK